MPAVYRHRVHALVRIVALLPFLAFGTQAQADWISGRGSDSAGVSYLAVINDSETGERIELNCTPSGEAFLALSWSMDGIGAPAEGPLTLRFLVDGSRRFAAPARFRALDKGWAAAELDRPEILGLLTEALVLGQRDFMVDVVQHGVTVAHAVFDMTAASESIGRYRSYCRL